MRLRLRGELDLATHPLLDARLRELLAGPQDVVVDLSALSFMDSSGVRCLHDFAREPGLTVAARMAPAVRQVLELTGVLSLLPIEELDGGGD